METFNSLIAAFPSIWSRFEDTNSFVYNTNENGSFKSAPAACTVIPSFPATEPATSAATRTFTTFSLTYLLNLLI